MSDLQIGDVADLFNISTKTLRHYEKLGLIEPLRSENGYRLYQPEHVKQIQRIRSLQQLGLSLRRIKQMLVDQEGPLDWDAVLASLLDETESEIAALEARRERLEGLLESDGEMVDPIVVARPADDERVNAYLAEFLPEPALLAWQRENGVYAMLQARDVVVGVNSAEFVTIVGYAGPIPVDNIMPVIGGPAFVR